MITSLKKPRTMSKIKKSPLSNTTLPIIKDRLIMTITRDRIEQTKKSSTNRSKLLSISGVRVWSSYKHGLSTKEMASIMKNRYTSNNIRKIMDKTRIQLGFDTNEQTYEHLKKIGLLNT